MMQNQPSRFQLLQYLSEVSFALNDITLYLDTHPDDERALAYCQETQSMRKEALNQYSKLYGPLTIDTADISCSRSWEWVNQPWPWEPQRKGGCCQPMWNYEKRLQYPVNITTPNAKLAQCIMSQYGGLYCCNQ